jgi:hypothetical protein
MTAAIALLMVIGMAKILQITNGQDTIDFVSADSSYSLLDDGYTPAVADRQTDSVDDVMRISISGNNIDADIRRLTAIIQQADRVENGSGEPVPTIIYQPKGGDKLHVARLMGLPDSGGMMRLPGNYDSAFSSKRLGSNGDPLTVRFKRLGQWLSPSQTNLIVNGDFERWSEDATPVPEGWTETGAVQVDQEDTIVFTGTYAARLSDFSISDTFFQAVSDMGKNAQYKVSARIYMVTGIAIIRAGGIGTVEINSKDAGLIVGQWGYVELFATASDAGVGDIIFARGTADAEYIVDDVQMFKLGTTGDAGDTATADDEDNGGLVDLPFGSNAELPSPTRFAISNFRYGPFLKNAFVVVSDSPGDIIAKNGADVTLATDFTHVADATAFAPANILRYTAATTNGRAVTLVNIGTEFAGANKLTIFACTRNNSSTTAFSVRVQALGSNGIDRGQTITMPGTASPVCQWQYFGELTYTNGILISLVVQASAASGTLDFSRFVILRTDNVNTSVIAIDGTGILANQGGTLILDHKLLTEPLPQIEIATPTVVRRWGGRGGIAVYTQRATIAAMLLGTGGATTANRWRQTQGTGGGETLSQNDWTASRLPARLTPG